MQDRQMERSKNPNEQEQARKMESEAEGNNERRIIPSKVREEGEMREENKGRWSEGGR